MLGDEIAGLDYGHAQLVLAAIASAAGFHEPVRSLEVVDENAQVMTKPPLFTWPI